MLFLLTNRTRPNLSAAQYGELATLAKAFYASIPADVKIRGEWAAWTSRTTSRCWKRPTSTPCAASRRRSSVHRDGDRAGDGHYGWTATDGDGAKHSQRLQLADAPMKKGRHKPGPGTFGQDAPSSDGNLYGAGGRPAQAAGQQRQLPSEGP